MSAAARDGQPIRKPPYNNTRIGDREHWLLDNNQALIRYWWATCTALAATDAHMPFPEFADDEHMRECKRVKL